VARARPTDVPAGRLSFVSEGLTAVGDEFALPPAVGEPALPLHFNWRRRTHAVTAVLPRWKACGPDRTHGSDERYLRRHWYALRMADGAVWTVYFQRQPGSRRTAKARWWLYGTQP